LKRFLTHEEPLLREKAVQFLEPFLKEKLVPLVKPLRNDPSLAVQSRVLWVLAKYTREKELTEQIMDALNKVVEDTEQIFLAAALYLIDNSPQSREMLFVKDFFCKHFFDCKTNTLKVLITGSEGYAAQLIGMILGEAGIPLFETGSLEVYNLLWLIK